MKRSNKLQETTGDLFYMQNMQLTAIKRPNRKTSDTEIQ